MAKTIFALFLTAVTAVIILAFLFTDFGDSTSETKIESHVANASSDTQSGNLEVNLSGRLYVYVVEDDDLTQELKYLLIRNLSEKQNGVLDVNSLRKNYDGQVLIVMIKDREISYNPFFPSAKVETIFYYSNTGNADTFENCSDHKPLMAYFEKSGTVICGISGLTDSTKGITSLKAYRKHLAEEITKNIVQQLPCALC
ncbi:MAG: hypothetical protein FIB08_16420 [Candidatus Methanoperedens sp.]|nr:hypothetical protein [Candidatus Methanoperedens sp.]